MYKCIYCNSEDLTVSDIIPYALTGAKLTRKFVCREHNAFTNEHFEKYAIENWQFFRSALGLSERSGERIKYSVDLHVDGMVVKNMSISGRASIYNDKKRLFHASTDNGKALVGNVKKLKQIKGASEENIQTVDMSNAVVSVSFDLIKLLASNEMLRTIAKIAYEWYCCEHNVEFFMSDRFQGIVNCILEAEPIEDYIEICDDWNADFSLSQLCSQGSHGIFEYDDIDGFRYVILYFWGVVLYKIRICKVDTPNSSTANMYSLSIYSIDGERSKTVFGTYGLSTFHSIPAEQAVRKYYKIYNEKLEKLSTITVLSLAKVKQMNNELKKAFEVYKREPHDFALFVDFESNDRFVIMRLLSDLLDNKESYSFEMSFNDNMKLLYNTDDTFVTNQEEKSEFLKKLLSMHDQGNLIYYYESAFAFFDKVCNNDDSMNNE